MRRRPAPASRDAHLRVGIRGGAMIEGWGAGFAAMASISRAGRKGAGSSLPRSGRCLVVALDGLGDMVLRQPLLSGLADAGYEPYVLVQAGYEPLLRFLDERLRAIPASLSWTSPPTVATVHVLLDQLRRLAPALVVSAQFNPVRYAEWIVQALPGAFCVGFAGGSAQDVPGARLLETALGLPEHRAFDLVVTCDESMPETDKACQLLTALTGRAQPSEAPRLTAGPPDREQALAVLSSLGLTEGRFAICYPAGTKNVTIKAWPAERYGRIAAWLACERGLPILVMGHQSEAAVLDAVVAAAREAGAGVQVWCGGENDLATMIALLASAGLYVGNDTGAMHIAAAADVAVVAVFGGGHWPRFLPVTHRGAVHTRKLPCFGCGWKECFFGDGPCVGRVEEEAVRASVLKVLEGAHGFEVHDDPLDLGEADWGRAVTAFRALSSRSAALREERLPPAPTSPQPGAPIRTLAARIGDFLRSVTER